MSNSINWKSKYAELVDQQEKQQDRYGKKSNLLITALGNISSLAQEIDDSVSDEKLAALQSLLTQEKMLNVDLEKAVKALAKHARMSLIHREEKLASISVNLQKISKAMRASTKDSEATKALKLFEKRLSGKARSYSQIPLLLEHLAELQPGATSGAEQTSVCLLYTSPSPRDS